VPVLTRHLQRSAGHPAEERVDVVDKHALNARLALTSGAARYCWRIRPPAVYHDGRSTCVFATPVSVQVAERQAARSSPRRAGDRRSRRQASPGRASACTARAVVRAVAMRDPPFEAVRIGPPGRCPPPHSRSCHLSASSMMRRRKRSRWRDE
jgi:hypothetical protein